MSGKKMCRSVEAGIGDTGCAAALLWHRQGAELTHELSRHRFSIKTAIRRGAPRSAGARQRDSREQTAAIAL
eukprot:scaffold13611_cov141-Isochrysis_galbana.AAC.4